MRSSQNLEQVLLHYRTLGVTDLCNLDVSQTAEWVGFLISQRVATVLHHHKVSGQHLKFLMASPSCTSALARIGLRTSEITDLVSQHQDLGGRLTGMPHADLRAAGGVNVPSFGTQGLDQTHALKSANVADAHKPVGAKVAGKATVRILCDKHYHGPSEQGKYFHFAKEDLDCHLGPDWDILGDGRRFAGTHVRTDYKGTFRVWRKNAGGDNGDASGRFDGDQIGYPLNFFQVGDEIIFDLSAEPGPVVAPPPSTYNDPLTNNPVTPFDASILVKAASQQPAPVVRGPQAGFKWPAAPPKAAPVWHPMGARAGETGPPIKQLPLSELFKLKEGEWECELCMVRNQPGHTRCPCCETPKEDCLVKSAGRY